MHSYTGVVTVRNFYYTVVRCIQWFPVLWKNYDFDSGYLLIIIEYKLRRMEKQFATRGTCRGSARRAQEMHVARLLLNRIIADDYSDAAFICVQKSSMFFDCYFQRRPLVPKQELWDYEDYMRNQDLAYLFRLFQKHLSCWWD